MRWHSHPTAAASTARWATRREVLELEEDLDSDNLNSFDLRPRARSPPGTQGMQKLSGPPGRYSEPQHGKEQMRTTKTSRCLKDLKESNYAPEDKHR